MYTYNCVVPETNPKDLRPQLKEEEVAMKSPLALVRLLGPALLNRHQSKKLKSSRARFPQRPNFSLEPLEDRLLLSADLSGMAASPDAASLDAASLAAVTGPSTIVWSNRGTRGDNFNRAFGEGAAAAAARAVMDAAIDSWNRVITDFNHNAGIGPPDINITISMNLADKTASAAAGTTFGRDGKPISGSISMGINDPDGAGKGNPSLWFIDPTPFDNSEFLGPIENAFALNAQGGSPAAGRGDFFTVALAELTHVMGLGGVSPATNRFVTGGFMTNTNTADNAEGGVRAFSISFRDRR